jgi:hypothetical protein
MRRPIGVNSPATGFLDPLTPTLSPKGEREFLVQ